jgi:hypothetical protein
MVLCRYISSRILLFVIASITGFTQCANLSAGDDSAFKYRSIYSPYTRTLDQRKALDCGNLDYDWGLWGHNMHKILGKQVSDDVYALVNGCRNEEQYCFSSEQLYRSVEHFIVSYHTKHKSGRFVIMPNDNAIVCQCEKCRKKGNSLRSASPAVTAFISKLANRFPHDEFFTSSYLSVKEPPVYKMPDNVGVIISAIDLPFVKGFAQTKSGVSFSRLIESWKNKVGQIYVWDYMSNFDDYLSPYPVLGLMQKRLQWYQEKGVRGIILNGSGDDYSAFGDMQTEVLAKLLLNPYQKLDQLVNQFYVDNYPETGELIANYYLSLEKHLDQTNGELAMYGGINDEVRMYLSVDNFLEFVRKLDKMSKGIVGDERRKLNILLTGFNYTQLELIRASYIPYNAEYRADCLNNLEGGISYNLITHYREGHGKLSDYIAYSRSNKPKVGKYKSFVCSNEPLMSDGYIGSAYDYHVNWVHSSTLTTDYKCMVDQSNGVLTIGCLLAPIWHIYAPKTVQVWQGARLIAETDIPYAHTPDGDSELQRLLYRMPVKKLQPNKPFDVRIILPNIQGKVAVACDEIQFELNFE